MPFRHPTYTWNERAQRYMDPRGRFVASREIRRALDAALSNAEGQFATLANQLRDRLISVEEWELGMRHAIKRVHLYSAAGAKGGWAQMSPADFGRVGQRVKAQYKFLNGFAQQLAGGLPLDGRFLRRVAMYAQAGRGTYHQLERLAKALAGFTEERSLRHARDSCDGCVAAAAMRWQPIGTIPAIGTRDCLTACQCEMEYRK